MSVQLQEMESESQIAPAAFRISMNRKVQKYRGDLDRIKRDLVVLVTNSVRKIGLGLLLHCCRDKLALLHPPEVNCYLVIEHMALRIQQ
jgi:hypothetical protein